MRPLLAITALAVVFVALPRPAAAYIDPSAGSMVLQLLLGGVAGLLVIVKLSYRRVMTRLGLRARDPDPADPATHSRQ